MPSPVVLRGRHSSIFITFANAVPVIAAWGRNVGGHPDSATLASLQSAVPHGGFDAHSAITVLPVHADASGAAPAVEGHRSDGTSWAPRFQMSSIDVRLAQSGTVARSEASLVGTSSQAGVSGTNSGEEGSGDAIEVTLDDTVAQLRIVWRLRIDTFDVVHTSITLRNTGSNPYVVSRCMSTLPISANAREVLDFPGRWTYEMQPQRRPLGFGALLWENRKGRPSHKNAPGLFVGPNGFSENSGEVAGFHLGWSGYHELRVDRLPNGQAYLQAGQALLPGELVLGPGEEHTSPTLFGCWSETGLNGVSQSFHEMLRARTSHPKTVRPVTLNTWEAVYFDHRHERLTALADAAAKVGIERYVLDDGWFLGRRDDKAGLGDWYVDPAVYPQGLGPLIDHVRSLGMEFGIWFEPEMVNPNSNLYREHPEWTLDTDGYEQALSRNQLVLDLSNPDVVEYLFERIDSILSAHNISYVKWDFNRDIVQGSHEGRASMSTQTNALYGLFARLVRAHPNVEFESCSSGGGRADYAILEHTKRVWTSDCNDALDRQSIQRTFSYFFPPEIMGSHIGPKHSHTTGRVHTLGFRGSTAFFGHLGVEADLTQLDQPELDQLANIIGAHKEWRDVLHEGQVIRLDHPDTSAVAHGVVSFDKKRAVFSYAQLATLPATIPTDLRLSGLGQDTEYLVEFLNFSGTNPFGAMKRPPAWVETGVVLSGAYLTQAGLPLPILHPETAMLITLKAR